MGVYDLFKPSEPPQHVQTIYANENTPYGQQALDGELAVLRAAQPGYRNPTLNDVAFRVFQLVDAGHVVEADAMRQLGDAAHQIGLGASEISNTLRSARQGARTHPRRAVPDPTARPQSSHDDLILHVPLQATQGDQGAPPVDQAPPGPYDHLYLPRPDLEHIPRGEPLITDVVDRRALFMIVGRDQSYKSFIGLDWLCSVATGRPWYGHSVQPGRVLYVVGEGAYGLHNRVLAWETANVERLPQGALTVRVAPVNLYRQDAAYVDLLARCEAEQWDLIMFDTLQRMTSGGNMDLAADASVVIQAMDYIRRLSGGSVGIVAHSGKADIDARGSSALEDDIDIVWRVKKDDDDDSLHLWQDKRKDGPANMAYHLKPRLVDGTGSLVLRDARSESLIIDSGPQPWPRHALNVLEALAEPIMVNGTTPNNLAGFMGVHRESVMRALNWLLESRMVCNTSVSRVANFMITAHGRTQTDQINVLLPDQHKQADSE